MMLIGGQPTTDGPGVNPFRADSSRVRGGAERRAPPAERPAIGATRWRRLLAAVADSF